MGETVTFPAFTPAQRRALDWLPADGSWRGDAKGLRAALESLGCYHRKLVQIEWRKEGPNGETKRMARATADGVALKALLAGNDA